jgi:hypothetical protein
MSTKTPRAIVFLLLSISIGQGFVLGCDKKENEPCVEGLNDAGDCIGCPQIQLTVIYLFLNCSMAD